MDTVVSIFTQLGADGSIVYQFVVLVVLFVIARPVFLNKLQLVLELRDEKTFKLEESAAKKLIDAEKVAENYKKRMDEAYDSAQKVVNSKKDELKKKEYELLTRTEGEISIFVDNARKEHMATVEEKKKEIFSAVDNLANELVTKLK